MDLEFYNGTHTGQQVDDGLDKALTPDETVTENSTELITSGAVYDAIDAEASARDMAIQQAVSASNPSKLASTLTAANWVSNVYSFESTYPAGDYDLTVEVSDQATSGQYDAFAAGMIVGSATENKITALGVVPTVNIPIVLTVRYVGSVT